MVEYAGDRVFYDKKLPSTEKVLSLSDGSAAYIKKGGREPVIGYKPQLVRSEQGFVTSLIVPEGNAADSIKLESAIREAIERTGVIAELVSTDDGYASAKGRDEVLGMGVKVISISGSKGKKLTDPEDWESQENRNARRNTDKRPETNRQRTARKDSCGKGAPKKQGKRPEVVSM